MESLKLGFQPIPGTLYMVLKTLDLKRLKGKWKEVPQLITPDNNTTMKYIIKEKEQYE